MKTAYGCKILGAHQALRGVRDGVVLFHSVVGCNFGTMALHFSSCDMRDVCQTCTVISDNEVVFGGGESVKRALASVKELYAPKVIFLVTGCVSDIIQDDVRGPARTFERETGTRVITVEAAGYRGSADKGFEEALKILAEEMDMPGVQAKKGERIPVLNIIGPGFDDPRLDADLAALSKLLSGKARLGTVFARCDFEKICSAADADLNLVFGPGKELAREMNHRFGTPWEALPYPYGLTGAEELWSCLERRFCLDFHEERAAFAGQTSEGAGKIYSYLQALYGLPAAVIGTSARARGLRSFLTRELGMEMEVYAEREQVKDLENFYDEVRASETAVLFGSSFEQELADELKIPLFRFDFPVFDRICLTDRPYVGAKGTLCFLEDFLNEAYGARSLKGAMYQ